MKKLHDKMLQNCSQLERDVYDIVAKAPAHKIVTISDIAYTMDKQGGEIRKAVDYLVMNRLLDKRGEVLDVCAL